MNMIADEIEDYPRIPLDELLTWPSVDAIGFCCPGLGEDETVASIMDVKTEEIRSTYGWLDGDWEQEAPIHVYLAGSQDEYYGVDTSPYGNSPIMGNGHHRVAMLLLMGATEVAVTLDYEESQ
jgi:hypothetical protein